MILQAIIRKFVILYIYFITFYFKWSSIHAFSRFSPYTMMKWPKQLGVSPMSRRMDYSTIVISYQL